MAHTLMSGGFSVQPLVLPASEWLQWGKHTSMVVSISPLKGGQGGQICEQTYLLHKMNNLLIVFELFFL